MVLCWKGKNICLMPILTSSTDKVDKRERIHWPLTSWSLSPYCIHQSRETPWICTRISSEAWVRLYARPAVAHIAGLPSGWRSFLTILKSKKLQLFFRPINIIHFFSRICQNEAEHIVRLPLWTLAPDFAPTSWEVTTRWNDKIVALEKTTWFHFRWMKTGFFFLLQTIY